MAKTLFLLRHGDTGVGGRLTGATDLPVDSSGYARLQSTRVLLRKERISAILCSPMLRCRQTAQELALDPEVELDHDLREIDFGQWEGMTFDEISAAWPEKVREWSNWSEDFTFPGGENIGVFLRRLQRVRQRIDLCSDERLLVITHGGVIRHLLCLYLCLPPEKYLLFAAKPGCYSTLSLFSEGGVLTSFNRGYSS